VVFDSENPPPDLKDLKLWHANHCDIITDPVKRTTTLALLTQPSPSSLVFHVTDKPFPPQPPAQTGEVASTSADQPPGVVDPSVGRAIERLNRGGDPADLAPGAPAVRGAVPGNVLPAARLPVPRRALEPNPPGADRPRPR
jgi:hypothetical protein